MHTKTYDLHCARLAALFLSETKLGNPKNVHDLAYEIQTCIEDFIHDLEEQAKEKRK